MENELTSGAGAGSHQQRILLSVIIPARNEAESIRACLKSLIQQSEEGFELGREWELLVVDDASSDGTRQIATEFAGVTVLQAPPLSAGWTGKNSAVWFGAQHSRGEWLLFTDADTVHEKGNLQRALHEAERHRVGMLSYSPRQMVHGFWQRALMPLIFSDLAQKYPPQLVSQPDSPVAAANGQFLLVDHAIYHRLGGHAAIRDKVLEDVEFARRAKQAKVGLRFRYAPDAVSTRMYRSFPAMYEGWKKNLSQLFPDALLKGFWKLFQSILIFGLPLLAIWMHITAARAGLILGVGLWWIWRVGLHYSRVSKSNFPAFDTALSPLALPLFSWLLIDSWIQANFNRQVKWKGRSYTP